MIDGDLPIVDKLPPHPGMTDQLPPPKVPVADEAPAPVETTVVRLLDELHKHPGDTPVLVALIIDGNGKAVAL